MPGQRSQKVADTAVSGRDIVFAKTHPRLAFTSATGLLFTFSMTAASQSLCQVLLPYAFSETKSSRSSDSSQLQVKRCNQKFKSQVMFEFRTVCCSLGVVALGEPVFQRIYLAISWRKVVPSKKGSASDVV